MDIVGAVLYAWVQGFSEFLPISSSGHLGLLEIWLDLPLDQSLSYTLTAHFGTLLAILIFLRKDIYALCRPVLTWQGFRLSRLKHSDSQWASSERALRQRALKWLGFILVANIPAAIIGLAFKPFFARHLQNLWIIGCGFLITAVVLWLMYRKQRRRGDASALPRQGGEDLLTTPAPSGLVALAIGCAQAFAIFPGVSRSGMTIAAGFWGGLHPALAARVSFLIAIPVIAGGFLLNFLAAPHYSISQLLVLLSLMLLAAIFGFCALKLIFILIRRNIFHYCAFYLLILGILTLLYSFVSGSS